MKSSWEDEWRVCQTLYRYAWALDRRMWDQYRATFTDQVEVDFSSYFGRPSCLTADEWVSQAQPTFAGLDATQHTMTNPLVEIEGDRAECRMYVQAAHLLRDDEGDRWFTIGGWYEDRLVRLDGRWLICAVTLNMSWSTGDPGVMRDAYRGARHRQVGP